MYHLQYCMKSLLSSSFQITSPELVRHFVTKSPVSGLLTSHATLTVPVRQRHFRLVTYLATFVRPELRRGGPTIITRLHCISPSFIASLCCSPKNSPRIAR